MFVFYDLLFCWVTKANHRESHGEHDGIQQTSNTTQYTHPNTKPNTKQTNQQQRNTQQDMKQHHTQPQHKQTSTNKPYTKTPHNACFKKKMLSFLLWDKIGTQRNTWGTRGGTNNKQQQTIQAQLTIQKQTTHNSNIINKQE